MCFRKRKREKAVSEEKNGQNSLGLFVEEDNKSVVSFKPATNNQSQTEDEIDVKGFYEIADLTNQSVKDVIESCYTFQLKKLMNRITKAVVRYDISSVELGKVLNNSKALNLHGVILSPAFLSYCRNEISKNTELNQNIGVIVDFPFGESSLKSKIISLNDCISYGVENVTLMLSSILFNKDKKKELKKTIKSVAKLKNVQRGLAVSVMDLDEEKLKNFIKISETYRVDNVTLVFGNVTEAELKDKLSYVAKYCIKTKIYVMANIDSINAVNELIKLNADVIITPFADRIGAELLQKFNIKSINII